MQQQNEADAKKDTVCSQATPNTLSKLKPPFSSLTSIASTLSTHRTVETPYTPLNTARPAPAHGFPPAGSNRTASYRPD